MRTTEIHLVYFSATYTTRKTAREIARAIGGKVIEHDVTDGLPRPVTAIKGGGKLLIAAAPVYAGRIPGRMAEALKTFRGDGTPAIVACVYGNRDYDDALVELQDCVEAQGFRTVAAGAFIGRHCIFPAVAAGRPDADDMVKIEAFATDCARLLDETADLATLPALNVKGNRPYKQAGASTFCPTGDAGKCDGCLTCVRLCPAKAIPVNKSRKTYVNLMPEINYGLHRRAAWTCLATAVWRTTRQEVPTRKDRRPADPAAGKRTYKDRRFR